ncbi:MAG TPA: LPS export ABC transporter periplasmic protein LptC, partial [Sphingomicrobium sp.]
MLDRFGLAQGPVTVAANQGQYNLDRQQVTVKGPVRVAGPEGEQLLTRDVTVDLKKNVMTSDGGVAGRMELGQFQASRLRADLNDRTVVLDGGARLKIVQGAVR